MHLDFIPEIDPKNKPNRPEFQEEDFNEEDESDSFYWCIVKGDDHSRE